MITATAAYTAKRADLLQQARAILNNPAASPSLRQLADRIVDLPRTPRPSIILLHRDLVQ